MPPKPVTPVGQSIRGREELKNSYSQFKPLGRSDKQRLANLARKLKNGQTILLVAFGDRFDDLTLEKLSTLFRWTTDTEIEGQEEGRNAWINDEIMNSYLHLICDDVRIYGYPNRASTLSSMSVQKVIEGKGLADGVIQKKKLRAEYFTKTTMHFWPFNVMGNHWVGYLIFPELKKILYFNSFGGKNNDADKNLLAFLKAQHLGDTYEVYHLAEDIQSETNTDKKNSSACGILYLAFAASVAYGFVNPEQLLQNALAITKGNMPYTVKILGEGLKHRRLRIMYELTVQKISSGTFGIRNRRLTGTATRVLGVQPTGELLVHRVYGGEVSDSDEVVEEKIGKPDLSGKVDFKVSHSNKRENRLKFQEVIELTDSDDLNEKNASRLDPFRGQDEVALLGFLIDEFGYPVARKTFEEIAYQTPIKALIGLVLKRPVRFEGLWYNLTLESFEGDTQLEQNFRIRCIGYFRATMSFDDQTIENEDDEIRQKFRTKAMLEIKKLHEDNSEVSN